MTEREPAGAPPTRPGVPLRIIWAALLGSVFVYAGALTVMPRTPGPIPAHTLFLMLAGVALLETGFAFLAPRLIKTPGEPLSPSPSAAVVVPIIRWGIADSIAVFGLVGALMGVPNNQALVFFIWAIALFVFFHPFKEAPRGRR